MFGINGYMLQIIWPYYITDHSELLAKPGLSLSPKFGLSHG